MTSPSPVDDDRGCTWDDDANAGIVLSCILTITAGGTTVALWLAPSVRRAMPWWWILPALLLGTVAGARWAVGG